MYTCTHQWIETNSLAPTYTLANLIEFQLCWLTMSHIQIQGNSSIINMPASVSYTSAVCRLSVRNMEKDIEPMLTAVLGCKIIHLTINLSASILLIYFTYTFICTSWICRPTVRPSSLLRSFTAHFQFVHCHITIQQSTLQYCMHLNMDAFDFGFTLKRLKSATQMPRDEEEWRRERQRQRENTLFLWK